MLGCSQDLEINVTQLIIWCVYYRYIYVLILLQLSGHGGLISTSDKRENVKNKRIRYWSQQEDQLRRGEEEQG